MRPIAVLALTLALTGCASRGWETPDTFQPKTFAAPAPPAAEPIDAFIDPTLPLDFEKLTALLRQHNPQLMAAAAAVRQAEGQALQAGLYPNPTAEAEVEDFTLGGAGLDGAQATLRVTQPFVWDQKRRDAVAAARAEVEVRRREQARLELELLGELREVFDELLYLEQAAALQDDLTSFTRQSLEIAQTRVELQASPASDLSRAEVEVFDLDLSRRTLTRDRDQAAARLTALLGGTSVQPERLQGSYLPAVDWISTEALRTWLMTEHPALQVARAEAEAARARLAREQSERLPELSVMAGAGHSLGEGEQSLEAAIGIELPIFDRNQGSIAAARADITRTEHLATALELDLLAELDQALAELAAARERRAFHARQVLPSAQRAFDQVREGYRAGKLGFLELIDAQRTLTAARLQQLQLVREIRLAENRLFGLAGPFFLPIETNPTTHAPEGDS